MIEELKKKLEHCEKSRGLLQMYNEMLSVRYDEVHEENKRLKEELKQLSHRSCKTFNRIKKWLS